MNTTSTPRPIHPASRTAFIREAISRRDTLAAIAEDRGAELGDYAVRIPSRDEVSRAAERVAQTGEPERIDIGMPFTFDIDTTNWPLAPGVKN